MEETSKTFYSKIAMGPVVDYHCFDTAMITRQYWYGFENKDFI